VSQRVDASDRGIAPGLLIAMPQLPDPNFERSVVLMVEHGPQGSLGLIVNRPTDILVADVTQALDVRWGGGEDVVWSGGPVQPRTGWLLHSPATPSAGDAPIEVTEGIRLSTSPDQLRAVAESPPARVRFLMGYSGWDSEQLEEELAAGAWLLAEATPDLVFDTPYERMWEAAIRSLGIDPSSLAHASGVH
jgi:putative transcriptional regulator